MQPASATAPGVAAVLAGTPVDMKANVAATVSVSGLTAFTPYKIYFVSKDAVNNVQALVQSVAATTALPAGYVSQGGLTWMPVTFMGTWANANAYCSGATLLGLTGWRLPTKNELVALYQNASYMLQGWSLSYTWSSTFIMTYNNENYYSDVTLATGYVTSDAATDYTQLWVACVY